MQAATRPKFRPGLEHVLCPKHQSDFFALDESYHHVALLQLYRWILNLPIYASEVRSSVKRIVACIFSMKLLSGPRPGVAILQPVFAAGSEACDMEDAALFLRH